MGAFNISITGVGGHGCERKAKAGEKLFGRCGRFNCPDCMAYEFVQQLRQKGMLRDGDIAQSVHACGQQGEDGTRAASLRCGKNYGHDGVHGDWSRDLYEADGRCYRQVPQQALFTHWPGQPASVVDDMLKNERKSGQF